MNETLQKRLKTMQAERAARRKAEEEDPELKIIRAVLAAQDKAAEAGRAEAERRRKAEEERRRIKIEEDYLDTFLTAEVKLAEIKRESFPEWYDEKLFEAVSKDAFLPLSTTETFRFYITQEYKSHLSGLSDLISPERTELREQNLEWATDRINFYLNHLRWIKSNPEWYDPSYKLKEVSEE